MRCSDCSQEVRPIVCVDVDGTMGDYHGHFLNFASEYLDIHKASNMPWVYDGTLQMSTWFTQVFNCDIATYRRIKLAYRQGGMKRTMPILPGAAYLCQTINKAGAELWITTTRPYLSLDNIVPDTVEWCRRHEIEYAGMLFDENKYEEFSKRVDPERVCLVLDDLGEMYDAAASVFGRPIPWLVMGHYNRGVFRPGMVDISGATDLAKMCIEDWRINHGN